MQQVVTQQAVDAAADAIVAAGGKPTFRLIQQRVGGSFTTLKPMLADWEARRGKGEEVAVEVPDALLARGADLVRSIYAELAQQARVESEAVRKDAEARVKALKAELAEATEEIARLEAQDAARADELAALREANRALELKVGGIRPKRTQVRQAHFGDTVDQIVIARTTFPIFLRVKILRDLPLKRFSTSLRNEYQSNLAIANLAASVQPEVPRI